MSTFYEEMKQVADDLILEFGVGKTITRKATVSYNPQTKVRTTTPANYTANVVISEYKDDEIDGQNIRRGDRKAFFGSSQSVPVIGDKMDDWLVKAVEPISPAEVDVTYVVQLRH